MKDEEKLTHLLTNLNTCVDNFYRHKRDHHCIRYLIHNFLPKVDMVHQRCSSSLDQDLRDIPKVLK